MDAFFLSQASSFVGAVTTSLLVFELATNIVLVLSLLKKRVQLS